ncbi:MAG TPA: hypothetical protein VGI48_06340 [Caldimonas sp.]
MASLLARCSIPVLLGALLLSTAARAAELTALETRWLEGIWPVIRFARETRLPLDVIVQPQDAPDAAPLALGFVDGRCKLVLSMRGNPEAEATLDRIAPELVDHALELMAAHELGHCRRYLDGTWFGGRAGFIGAEPPELGDERRAAYRTMRAVRREEGYADLVGLGWTREHHPDDYQRLHAWLLDERGRDLVPGSQHDTLAWLRLAGDAEALAGASIFTAADRLWRAGLAADGE